MNKLLLITIISLLITINMASAVIIESTTGNQNTYSNGDLVEILIDTNAEGLEVTGDFSTADSQFNPQMVIVEEEGDIYKIYYPITFGNTKTDDTYNAIISVYDPITSTSSTVSYGINLDNTERLEDQTDSETIKLKIEKEAEIIVQQGYIQICDYNSCKTITEKEYEETRDLVITNGNVTLSGLTYNQLRDEIQGNLTAEMKAELKIYLDQIIQTKAILDKAVFDLAEMHKDQQSFTQNVTERSERMIRKGIGVQIILAVLIITIIVLFAYGFYVRTQTTWTHRPK